MISKCSDQEVVRSISSANPQVNVNPVRSHAQRTFRSEIPIASPISTFSNTRSLSSSAAPYSPTNDENEPSVICGSLPKGFVLI
jgi:hypothetical protein